MSEYPWKEKNNTFTWLSSLYNPFKSRYFEEHLQMTASENVLMKLRKNKNCSYRILASETSENACIYFMIVSFRV